uniref:Retrotransposon Copia-like N-terminal domain-containing protein n=1 Tax=Nicotiana tabacum TaxID=4097 RepID=A0A1S4BQW4_TOBAC
VLASENFHRDFDFAFQHGIRARSSIDRSVAILPPSHPLYLYPSDSTGIVIVASTFNGLGYESWCRGMLIGLSCKNKLGLINRMVAKPGADSPLYEAWYRCNDMVTTCILNRLDLEIRESVMYTESAQKLWKEIEQRYGKPNGSKVFLIRKKISSTSQGLSNIASYFSRFKKLWDELTISITYPPCICGCKEGFQKLEEDPKVHQFLMGLNESYSNVRRSILMMKPLPNIDSVYEMLIEDES